MHYPDKWGIIHRRYTLILSFPHSVELPDTPGRASTPFSCAVVCASGEIVWRAFGAYRSRWLFAQTPMNGKDPSCVTVADQLRPTAEHRVVRKERLVLHVSQHLLDLPRYEYWLEVLNC